MSLKKRTKPDAEAIKKQAIPATSIPRGEVSDTRLDGDRNQRSRDHNAT